MRSGKTRARRAAGRCAVRDVERRPRPDRADPDGGRQLLETADSISGDSRRKRSPGSSLPTSRRRRGRREGCACGAGFRWGWGVFTRRMAVGANEKRPPPAPAFDARHQCVLVRARHHTARDMSLVALCRASPASRAPPPSCPALSTLSRPLTGRRFAGVAISTISLPSPPSHCHLHHLTAISLPSPPGPSVLYHIFSTTPAGVGAPESPVRA